MIAHEDVRRCVELPSMQYEQDAVEHMDRFHRMHRKRLFQDDGDPVHLLKKQAAALLCLENEMTPNGMIVPFLPGDGKTLVSFLAPGHLEQIGRIKKAKPLLAVPAKLRKKTFFELVEYGKNWKIVPPHVVSYSLISRRPHLLESDEYNIFVFDEAHKLKSPTSARTQRALTAIRERPDVIVILLSASFWGEGLYDCAHWLDTVLRDKTPIPLAKYKRRAWAKVLDIRVEDHEAWPWLGDMESLRRKFAPKKHGRDGCRRAFARRMACAPGIVGSAPNPDDMVAASLIVALCNDVVLSNECQAALQLVLATGERPDGEILPDPPRVWQCLRTLSSGFYYRWLWPGDKPDLLWLDARRRWGKAVRDELSGEHQKGYDTEGLVIRSVRAGKASSLLTNLYLQYLKETERIGGEPPKEAVWVDRSVPQQLVGIAERFDKPAILWIESIAVQEALQEDGIKVYREGELPPSKPTERVCGMSWRSHGEGQNLQAWSRCVIGEPPGGAPMWEQLLARPHRRGQKDDEVIFATVVHTRPLAKRLVRAVQHAAALAIQNGVPKRLAFADKIDADEVLRAPQRRA